MEKKLLQDIGLTNSEIQVYLALIKSGSIKIGDLMKNLDLHRSRVYEAINKLITKGLVSYIIKNNIKFFTASNPHNLINYIKEQKQIITKKEKAVKEILPKLKKQIFPTPEAEAHVFYGKQGFKAIRNDVLKQKKTLYLIGAVGKEDKYLEYYFPNFNKLRIKSKIKWKILYDHEVKGKKITKLKLMETRFLPKQYSTPAVINIYADKVVNVLWNDKTPICFMIKNKQIADSYKKWFELLWKASR